MSGLRVAAAHFHVRDADGAVVKFAPGDVIPAELAAKITNPAAFASLEEVPATIAPPATPAAPVVPVPPVAPPVTPAADGAAGIAPDAYEESGFKELQAEAKRRGLSGVGKKETLIARLEASDREAGDEPVEQSTAPADKTVPTVESDDKPQF